MHEKQQKRDMALTDLRKRLTDGLARARLTKTQLAARAELSRTTVQLAFQTDTSTPPSAETVAALARELRLPSKELLALRRVAAGEASPVGRNERSLGKPISDWNPHDLEIHPAGPVLKGYESGTVPIAVLPGYVPRLHDQVLTEAVQDASAGRSRMVILVGSSSTGKTRACWESVQPLTHKGWGLWHPFDPTRAQAALDDLRRVEPCTVVWLNEAQHYLGEPRVGEQLAAAVHRLLTDSGRGPVLILGTLWPEYADQYTVLPPAGSPDPHSRVREILAGRTLTIPDTFDQDALRATAALAQGGDELLADALTRTSTDGRVTQDLAGAPELLRRYEQGTPAVRAVMEAAMDARRLGVGLHLPQAFLIDAAIDYLSDWDYNQLAEGWAETAFADLARPVHGKQAPLRRTSTRPERRPPGSPTPATPPVAQSAGPAFRLADYLEQHGRSTRRAKCPPASFWHAAYTHLSNPDELSSLARAAESRFRLQWAYHLRHQVADSGRLDALVELARMRAKAGDQGGAEALALQAAEAGNASALFFLARMRADAGDRDGAEAFYRKAADAGKVFALVVLALMREEGGDRDGAEAFALQAAEAGRPDALVDVALMRESDGDRDGAEALVLQAAEAGDTNGLVELARVREEVGDEDGAEALYRRAADAGDSRALTDLAWMRAKAGDRAEAEALVRQAADEGSPRALFDQALMREEAGQRGEAEAFALQAAEAGNVDALIDLASMREEDGDRDGAEALALRAADAGHLETLVELALMRAKAGDQARAEALALRAAGAGNARALFLLALMREETGDRAEAKALALQAADIGVDWLHEQQDLGGWWPYGLDPDGTPTKPW
ncbi:SEL1-like repeat protein [Streptomyces griseocarneus]|uniref:SEL1-like repeat protein n=1 Tax=Streptomyces griseocarneus TaxID=51201 RepID=UPI001F61C38D|nr:tetratricopeptide repeat protein [Streptomyces griseocarneus]